MVSKLTDPRPTTAAEEAAYNQRHMQFQNYVEMVAALWDFGRPDAISKLLDAVTSHPDELQVYRRTYWGPRAEERSIANYDLQIITRGIAALSELKRRLEDVPQLNPVSALLRWL